MHSTEVEFIILPPLVASAQKVWTPAHTETSVQYIALAFVVTDYTVLLFIFVMSSKTLQCKIDKYSHLLALGFKPI